MVIGDPGIGKSTIMLEYLTMLNDTKKVLYISAEMNRIDMYGYIQRYPKMANIETLFFTDLDDDDIYGQLKILLKDGYDVVLIDSFIEVQESIVESNNFKRKEAENKIIDLLIENNEGYNDTGKYTSFLIIQQLTKGGTFVGSNKLKHNTTGMIEIRFEKKSKDRKITVTKNRRGSKHDVIFFEFGENKTIYNERLLALNTLSEDLWRDNKKMDNEMDAMFDNLYNETPNNKNEFDDIFSNIISKK
jgi:DNA repair protein RadA/Sms